MQTLARRGGVIEARLPCIEHRRTHAWRLNHLLCSGLASVAGLTEDASLRTRLHRLVGHFEFDRLPTPRLAEIEQAERTLDRQTEVYASSLRLLYLLLSMQGIEMEKDTGSLGIPGFVFDMNKFFQALLSRFLHDHVHPLTIRDEGTIRGLVAYSKLFNPRGKRLSGPRPDYSLYRGQALQGYLDAKYRDVWSEDLPREWLYQCAIYALASPSRTCVILYASMADDAREEQIDVHPPGAPSAAVVVRPVPLLKLAELLDPSHLPRRQADLERPSIARQHNLLVASGTSNLAA
jgi:5-methylcytosine-specific restriction enzyme subunit McrC